MSLSGKDIKQIQNRGLTIDQVNAQLEVFKKGLPFVNIESAATVGNGILNLSDSEIEHYINYFEDKRNSVSFIKFVPASGAATRMFKFLFDFLKIFSIQEETINAYVNRHNASDLAMFFVGIKSFPFYYIVKQKLYQEFKDFDDLKLNLKLLLFVQTMLDKDKLDYGNYPKGLFPFHQYKDHIATAFEEHLFEAAHYASAKGKADLHFTVSEKYSHKFDNEFDRIEKIVEKKTDTQFNIKYSFQKQSSDSIAVTMENEPLRDEEGKLVFRPSGHGALLENLNDLDADIIFIKNIDNVVVFKFEEEVTKYKKMLAGILLEIQSKVFKFQERLENGDLPKSDIQLISQFVSDKLNVFLDKDFSNWSQESQIDFLKSKLNRPIRVCGMVKNEGEPGGGPFWVRNGDEISLQIVESSQIDKNNSRQKAIFENSTYFNPVDLVCGVKNYKGEKYDLKMFVDHQTGFITTKTKSGKKLKALELPGLWNGSMAFWNTIFVEVPLITFNPVKTVNDLLKDPHQIK